MPLEQDVGDKYKLGKDSFFTVLVTLLQYITNMISFNAEKDELASAVLFPLTYEQ